MTPSAGTLTGLAPWEKVKAPCKPVSWPGRYRSNWRSWGEHGIFNIYICICLYVIYIYIQCYIYIYSELHPKMGWPCNDPHPNISNNGMVHWIIMAYNLHPTSSNIIQPTERNTYRLECSFMPHVKAWFHNSMHQTFSQSHPQSWWPQLQETLAHHQEMLTWPIFCFKLVTTTSSS